MTPEELQAEIDKIMRMAVRLEPADLRYDVNKDGRVSSADAYAVYTGAAKIPSVEEYEAQQKALQTTAPPATEPWWVGKFASEADANYVDLNRNQQIESEESAIWRSKHDPNSIEYQTRVAQEQAALTTQSPTTTAVVTTTPPPTTTATVTTTLAPTTTQSPTIPPVTTTQPPTIPPVTTTPPPTTTAVVTTTQAPTTTATVTTTKPTGIVGYVPGETSTLEERVYYASNPELWQRTYNNAIYATKEEANQAYLDDMTTQGRVYKGMVYATKEAADAQKLLDENAVAQAEIDRTNQTLRAKTRYETEAALWEKNIAINQGRLGADGYIYPTRFEAIEGDLDLAR